LNGTIDDPFPPNPMGMHRHTYRRLEALDNVGYRGRPAAVMGQQRASGYCRQM
jgi:hypothetical protein